MQVLRHFRRLFPCVFGVALAATSLAAAPALAAPAQDAPSAARSPQADGHAKRRVARRDPPRAGAEPEKKSGTQTTETKAAGKAAEKKLAARHGSHAESDDAKHGKDAKRTSDAKRDRGGEVDERKPLSMGAPNKGKLAGAVQLKPSKHLKFRDGARTWGLPVLVKTLRHAAGKVAKHHKRSVLLVGDLSARSGGALDGHNSHQSGRDADVGFYVVNEKGKPLHLTRFVPFDASGNAIGATGVRFDDARNWSLVEALLNDKRAGVKYLFITNPLRARLLAYAAKKRVPQDLLVRAAAAMMSPQDADLHNDHFHVRLTCPESMRGACIEESTARECPVANSEPLEAAPAGALPDVSHAEPATTDDETYPDDDKATESDDESDDDRPKPQAKPAPGR